MLRFDKATYLSPLFKFILSVRLSNEDQMFFVFIIHRYSIHFFYYSFIEFIILVYTFLVISFAQYKEYII